MAREETFPMSSKVEGDVKNQTGSLMKGFCCLDISVSFRKMERQDSQWCVCVSSSFLSRESSTDQREKEFFVLERRGIKFFFLTKRRNLFL